MYSEDNDIVFVLDVIKFNFPGVVRTGEQLDLGEGYAIEAKQVDVDGEKVWLEFTK
ncbi:S-layer protein domain-containing protein, partial [Methanosarcina mazei]|uniref:S-layer protein domain-containing protein n=1 Tax=Methanosarcina mazei TaxID=2209 RepID=UPI001F2B5782